MSADAAVLTPADMQALTEPIYVSIFIAVGLLFVLVFLCIYALLTYRCFSFVSPFQLSW